MTWVKLDDAFPGHPKVDALSDGAFRLHVTALCWCCQWLTDGYIPAVRLRSLPAYRYRASHVRELLAPRPPDNRAAWVEVEGGYQIHDFLVYQMPAAKVRADREAAAERMRKRRTPTEQTSNVRPNQTRTHTEGSGEVREKFGDPVPSRPVPPSQSSSNGSSPVAHGDPDDDDPRVREACQTLARRDLAQLQADGRPPPRVPSAWLETAAGRRHDRHAVEARSTLDHLPDLTPAALAELLDPVLPAEAEEAAAEVERLADARAWNAEQARLKAEAEADPVTPEAKADLERQLQAMRARTR